MPFDLAVAAHSQLWDRLEASGFVTTFRTLASRLKSLLGQTNISEMQKPILNLHR